MDFISIGKDCTTRYQILLVKFRLSFPNHPNDAFYRYVENLRDHPLMTLAIIFLIGALQVLML